MNSDIKASEFYLPFEDLGIIDPNGDLLSTASESLNTIKGALTVDLHSTNSIDFLIAEYLIRYAHSINKYIYSHRYVELCRTNHPQIYDLPIWPPWANRKAKGPRPISCYDNYGLKQLIKHYQQRLVVAKLKYGVTTTDIIRLRYVEHELAYRTVP